MSARSMEEPADLDMWLKYVTEKLPHGIGIYCRVESSWAVLDINTL